MKAALGRRGLASRAFSLPLLVIHQIALGDHREAAGAERFQRLRIDFAIQERPIGTANAVLSVERFVGADRFLVMNADNYYPVEAYAALRELGEPGLIAFGRDALLADGR